MATTSTPNMATTTHYNDWPNAQGFDVRHQELAPKELEVIGTIPAYAAGVLFRNGLGPREVQKNGQTVYKVSHWFDAFSQVHRFQIHAPPADDPTGSVRVTHSSRLTSDGVIERIRKTGLLTDFTFGAKRDPCMSLFQKAQAMFLPAERGDPNDVNVSVSLSLNFPGLTRMAEKATSGVDKTKPTLINKTDSSLMQMLDPETLEPIGIARQQKLHPNLSGPLSAAHARFDPETGDVFNYNLDLGGRTGTYRVFTVSAATGETSILATIHDQPAYLHSLFLSPNYVVLCVWNAFYVMGGAKMLWSRNLADSFAPYDAGRPATWYVIDRRPGGRGLVATYHSEAFFAFHSINAYEERAAGGENDNSEVDLVLDVCTFPSINVLTQFYINNLLSDSPAAKKYMDKESSWGVVYKRFRLENVPLPEKDATPTKNTTKTSVKQAKVEFTGPAELGGPELPRINEAYRNRQHRYVYGVTGSGGSTFLDGLVKLDVRTGESIRWSHKGQTAGEPIFVANPDPAVFGIVEDAGVLLSVVLDGIRGESYLLVLDARTMEEIGRANVGGVVGFGFHGLHVPRL